MKCPVCSVEICNRDYGVAAAPDVPRGTPAVPTPQQNATSRAPWPAQLVPPAQPTLQTREGFRRTLAARILASVLIAPVSAPAEAGRLRDKLTDVKQRIKLDIRAFKCVLNKGPCGF